MTRPYLAMREVRKRFGESLVLDGVSLEITRGELFYIVGTSGVGKSVTIKLLVGLLPLDAGELWFEGQRIDGYSEREFTTVRRKIALVHQHATLLDALTLAENVALPLTYHLGLSRREALRQAETCLAQVDMATHRDRYPSEFSDGLRKRVAIARALASHAEVLLFDEPTTGLDPQSARQIDALIRTLTQAHQKTVVVVSHDLASMAALPDRLAMLYRGRVHALATRDDFARSEDPIVRQFLEGRAEGPMETPGF